MTWGEVRDLIEGLRAEPSSHLRMEETGMRVAYTLTDIVAMNLGAFVINSLKSSKSDPVELPDETRPRSPEQEQVQVTDDDRARAAAMFSSIAGD